MVAEFDIAELNQENSESSLMDGNDKVPLVAMKVVCGKSGAKKWDRKVETLARFGYRCAYCGRDLVSSLEDFAAATVDHLRPISSGGHSNPKNLVSACLLCNMLKSNSPCASVEDAREIISARRVEIVARHAMLLASLRGVLPPTRPLAFPLAPANTVEMLARQIAALSAAKQAVEMITNRGQSNGPGWFSRLVRRITAIMCGLARNIRPAALATTQADQT